MADIEKLDLSMAGERCDDAVLPCPFCGSKNIAYGKYEHTAGRRYAIVCMNCMAEIDPGWAQSWGAVQELWNRRAQPAACEIAEYAEDCKDCGYCAQPANEPLIDVCAMLEQAAQDMDDKCRQWQCVLQRVHDAGTFDQNSGLWVGVDKEREAKAQASFEAYRYALGVIDKIAEHVSNPYKFAHKPGGEQE